MSLPIWLRFLRCMRSRTYSRTRCSFRITRSITGAGRSSRPRAIVASSHRARGRGARAGGLAGGGSSPAAAYQGSLGHSPWRSLVMIVIAPGKLRSKRRDRPTSVMRVGCHPEPRWRVCLTSAWDDVRKRPRHVAGPQPMIDTVFRIAAFTTNPAGGNPAGVWVGDAFPDPGTMLSIAAEVGYSETAFITPRHGGTRTIRYFSPEAEVSFCGHATIASGFVLGELEGDANFELS